MNHEGGVHSCAGEPARQQPGLDHGGCGGQHRGHGGG